MLLPDAEPQIQAHLQGWFRYQALAKLYQLQQRPDELAALQEAEQVLAEQVLVKLALVSVMPGLGVIIGIGLLIVIVSQRLIKGQQSWLAQNSALGWSTPWDGEVVWQVLILTFFVVGQIVLPLCFGLLGLDTAHFGARSQALLILVNYLLFGLAGFLILYLSIRQFLPLPAGWFRFNLRGHWLAWGLGGYLVAIPLVIVVSLVNDQIWQGRGGSNPLLPIALEGRNSFAMACFLITAAVAAPLFEEVMFRGFLLPSLTRYLSVNGSIFISSLLFAIAHLSLSEILPLTVLGMVLGFVYTRSRNLLSPILVHGLWNSGTLLTLFILGSGTHPG
ncbi:CPBP family intramembrane glutamic endopeptidase [Neosynechococcus sphagnicola]|uniref:CPBP family intramembrane glutamic endopeptidase n=1 Tax=Neosynechococcus sphagnicola TaxID=1501145 RepID=UPI0019554362|nr:type II CAAX endopeptidase family protein [Neosynechococcus sphagnicola]